MKKLIKIFSLIIFSLIFAVLIINLIVIKSTDRNIYSSDEIYNNKVALILGCGVYSDGTPSPMLKERLDKGIDLYNEKKVEKLIMSGDHGREEYDEVNIMKKYAIDSGVASKDIFMDHAGFSTYESIYRAKEIFDIDKVIVVSQKYHLYRALYVAKALDMDAKGVVAGEVRRSGQIGRDARELIARTKEFFKVIIKPEPTFLGEKISIDGNGDITND